LYPASSLLIDKENHENGYFSQTADIKPPEKLSNFFGGLIFLVMPKPKKNLFLQERRKCERIKSKRIYQKYGSWRRPFGFRGYYGT